MAWPLLSQDPKCHHVPWSDFSNGRDDVTWNFSYLYREIGERNLTVEFGSPDLEEDVGTVTPIPISTYLTNGNVLVSVLSSKGYCFTTELSAVYGAFPNDVTVVDDLKATISRAIRAQNSNVSDNRLDRLITQIFALLADECPRSSRLSHACLKSKFKSPKMPLGDFYSDKIKIYIGEKRGDQKLDVWLSISTHHGNFEARVAAVLPTAAGS